MKGAALVSKRVDFFSLFSQHAKKAEGKTYIGPQSLRIEFSSGSYFMLYDREEGNFTEQYELPLHAILLGYRYAFLVECRNEEKFCEIVGSLPPEMELLVFDNSGRLQQPSDISPETISL